MGISPGKNKCKLAILHIVHLKIMHANRTLVTWKGYTVEIAFSKILLLKLLAVASKRMYKSGSWNNKQSFELTNEKSFVLQQKRKVFVLRPIHEWKG